MDNVQSNQRLEELRNQSQRLLTNFVQAETNLGFTFAEFVSAERELGNIEHSGKARIDAEAAIATIRRFAPGIVDEPTRDAVMQRCVELEEMLAAL